MDDSGCTSISVVAQYMTWRAIHNNKRVTRSRSLGRIPIFAIHGSMLGFMDNPNSYGDAGTTDKT